MALFEKRIQDKIAGLQIPSRSGLVVNSYYENITAYVDVVMQDDDTSMQIFRRVPVLKLGGVSSSIPPVGSTAVLTFLDNNDSKPICLGYIDSDITKKFVKDDRRPRKPPTSMTR